MLAAIEQQFKKVHTKLQVRGWQTADRVGGSCWAFVSCPSAVPLLACCSFAGSPHQTPVQPLPQHHPPTPLFHTSPSLPCPPCQYLEEMDAVLSAERLSLEAMRGQFIDQYQKVRWRCTTLPPCLIAVSWVPLLARRLPLTRLSPFLPQEAHQNMGLGLGPPPGRPVPPQPGEQQPQQPAAPQQAGGAPGGPA